MPVVLRALALVVLASARNRLRSQLRRVRQPRYLVATAIGLLYWLFYFGPLVLGRAVRGAAPPPGAPVRFVELVVTGFGLLAISFYWVFGGDKAAVTFSEAEVQLLFPAPLSRRQLLHWRLLRALAASLLGAAFTALVLGRGLSGRPLLFTFGAWVAFSTLSFHGVAAALTRASLAEAGLSGLRRRLLTLAGLAAAVALVVWGIRNVAPPGPFVPTAEYAEAWASAVDASPLHWILWPARAPVRLALARTGLDFLAALPGALVVLLLHYAWVMSSAVQFEEASLEASERRARNVEAFRAGRGPAAFRAGKIRRPPFVLRPDGPPEVAFLWKGLIAGGRAFGNRRTIVLALTLTVALGAIATSFALERGARVGVGVLSTTLWAMAVLMGPRMIRSDLRADAASLELLRALPLPGARIVRGALLAPALTLALVQWALLPFMAAGLAAASDEGPGTVAVFVACAAALGPALSLALVAIQNGILVLLPGWAAAGDRPRGPEALGMNILMSLGNLLALAVAMIPAAVVGAALAWLVASFAGAHAAWFTAAAAAAIVLCVEVWAGTIALGAAFDRLDVSEP